MKVCKIRMEKVKYTKRSTSHYLKDFSVEFSSPESIDYLDLFLVNVIELFWKFSPLPAKHQIFSTDSLILLTLLQRTKKLDQLKFSLDAKSMWLEQIQCHTQFKLCPFNTAILTRTEVRIVKKISLPHSFRFPYCKILAFLFKLFHRVWSINSFCSKIADSFRQDQILTTSFY